MDATLSRNPLLGFIAAAIAVVIVHQGIIYLLANHFGLLPATTKAWNMAGVPPWGVPTILNAIFWGGLWGALFALIHDKLPGGAMWLKGLIYGLIITVISNFTLLPLIRRALGVTNQAQTALFAGGDPQRMLAIALILGGFGLALGIIYGLLASRRS